MYAPKNAEELIANARANEKGKSLLDQGYRLKFVTPNLVHILKPGSDFPAYQVDRIAGTCDCPAFTGRRSPGICKHTIAVQNAVAEAALMTTEPDAHDLACAEILDRDRA